MPGFGVFPGGMLSDVVASATSRPLALPKPGQWQCGYRPSTALAEFVRLRDMTCRFPDATGLPRCATSITPCPIPPARQPRRARSCCAACIICSKPTARAVLEDAPQIAGLSWGYCGASDRRRRTALPGIRPRTGLRRIMKVKLDTMSLISAAIAVAIWVLVIWTAVVAIVAHI